MFLKKYIFSSNLQIHEKQEGRIEKKFTLLPNIEIYASVDLKREIDTNFSF